MEQSYWNSNGQYQKYSEELANMVPISGSVAEPRKNRALEMYRKAANCYYDLYNNGLCNRASQFRTVFGIPSSHYGNYKDGFSKRLYEQLEEKMSEIILAAAKEQKLIENESE